MITLGAYIYIESPDFKLLPPDSLSEAFTIYHDNMQFIIGKEAARTILAELEKAGIPLKKQDFPEGTAHYNIVLTFYGEGEVRVIKRGGNIWVDLGDAELVFSSEEVLQRFASALLYGLNG